MLTQGPILSYPYTGTTDLVRGRRVKISSGEPAYASATEQDIGEINLRVVATPSSGAIPLGAGQQAAVLCKNAPGLHEMVAVEAITAETDVYAAANGKVAASGTIRVGRATTTVTADGDLVLVDRSTVIPSPTDLAETVTATNVITAQENGKTFFLSSATEFVSTLPAPAAGLKFKFIVAAAPSGASYTIVTASSANIIKGAIFTSDVNSATDADFETSGGDTISLVDGKAVAGDCVEVESDGTNWFARAFCTVFDAITITTAS